MSRGYGILQRNLFQLITDARKPMTFGEIRTVVLQDLGVNDPDRKLRPSFERSLRRSLKALADGGAIMALGEGGRGDPKRYWLDPLMVAITGDKEAFHEAMTILEADPGASLACTRRMQRMAK